MLEEMRAIKDNGTWELVDPPVGCRPIRLKWVYKVKRDEHGAIVKYKARLVAHGFVQRESIDFEEVFAPVARMESIRLLLAMAAQRIGASTTSTSSLRSSTASSRRRSSSSKLRASPSRVLSTRCSSCARRSTGCGRPLGCGTPNSTPPWASLGSLAVLQSTCSTCSDRGRRSSSSMCKWMT